MNYISAVYGVVGCVITVDWLLRARKSFRGQELRHDEISALTGTTGNGKNEEESRTGS